ncbi:MAG TPA: metalloregulator ArsR/SmtB family transcription factor [Anaerolineae bacterium]|nr:metalloregulator ArsR/SmtB family transcription factor [Anaerolineae bacterium]
MNDVSTRRQIMSLLRTKGRLTAQSLADELKITAMGVRRHLTTLERDGLVKAQTQRQPTGRPTFLYSLTEAGMETFPKSYDLLATQLLDVVRTREGDARVNQIFAGRMDQLYEQYAPRMAGKNLAERVAELARIQEEAGYMARWEKVPGGYLLKEQNCAIYRVACRFQDACQFEIELFRRLLGADLKRVEHQVKGDLACTYFVPENSLHPKNSKHGSNSHRTASR